MEPATKQSEALEEWRPIVGFNGYEVSNLGNVRSWKKSKNNPKILRGGSRGFLDQYRSVALSLNGRLHHISVHRAVAAAFCEKRSSELNLVRHLDGNPRNNAAVNLAWGTPSENAEDSFRHGTMRHGESSPVAILSRSEVRSIIADRTSTDGELAQRYGVSRTLVCAIRRRVNRTRETDGFEPLIRGRGQGREAAKLTTEQVKEIFYSTQPRDELAEKYGVHHHHINSIKSGRRWGQVTAGVPK